MATVETEEYFQGVKDTCSLIQLQLDKMIHNDEHLDVVLDAKAKVDEIRIGLLYGEDILHTSN